MVDYIMLGWVRLRWAFDLPNQTFKFWHIFINILEPDAYFSKPIFALKPWAQAGRFEYNEPYKLKTFFFP